MAILVKIQVLIENSVLFLTQKSFCTIYLNKNILKIKSANIIQNVKPVPSLKCAVMYSAYILLKILEVITNGNMAGIRQIVEIQHIR